MDRTPVYQVPAHIAKAAGNGVQRIEIALDPPALGRIDVRLEFADDGRIRAHFVTETRDALQALRADARSLERALADAGVRTDAGSLGFSLRDGGGDTGGFAQSFGRQASRAPSAGPASVAASVVDAAPPRSASTGGSRRLDIRA